jgi:hypothetical protein
MPVTEASAKIRSGPPDDGEGPDGALPVWAGVVPLVTTWGQPLPDPLLAAGVPVPASVRRLLGGDAAPAV